MSTRRDFLKHFAAGSVVVAATGAAAVAAPIDEAAKKNVLCIEGVPYGARVAVFRDFGSFDPDKDTIYNEVKTNTGLVEIDCEPGPVTVVVRRVGIVSIRVQVVIGKDHGCHLRVEPVEDMAW
jgi:hypothetical protein